MFCGGVFAFNNDQEDIFICSDGVEMSQKELLNICRGAMSLLYTNPLENGGRKVLFVEAASTLLTKYQNYTLGVSTYHQQSIPVLCSTMERILSFIQQVFPDGFSLSNNHTRSQMFHSIRQILGNNQGIIPSPQITKLMNIIEDVNLNKPGSYHMNPVVSGEFVSTEPLSEEMTSTDVASTMDSLATNAFSGSATPGSPSRSDSPQMPINVAETGTLDVALNEEVTFNAVNGVMSDSEVDIRITALANCKSDMGGVFMKLPQQPSGVVVRTNPQVIQEAHEYYSCPSPTASLKESTPIFAIQGKDMTPRELPIMVKSSIMQNETHAKISFEISSKYEVNSFIIGVEGQGIDPSQVASQNSEVTPGVGANFILRPNASIPAGGGTIEASFFGPLSSPFTKPTFANVQCKIPNVVLADVKPEMKPGSNFILGDIKKFTFIQRSLWPIAQ